MSAILHEALQARPTPSSLVYSSVNSFVCLLIFDLLLACDTGDTLFLGGCGRFNNGTAEQMYTALVEKLGKLDGNTQVSFSRLAVAGV